MSVHKFVTKILKPKFKGLPAFNSNQTKASRIQQHVESGKGYQEAVRTTDREFKTALDFMKKGVSV
jgi:hypothetical protein